MLSALQHQGSILLHCVGKHLCFQREKGDAPGGNDTFTQILWVLKFLPRRIVLFCEKFSEVYFNLSANLEKSLVLENFKTSELHYDKAQSIKNLPAMQKIWVRSLGWEDPLEEGSCLENPMDRGAWWATVHGVTKSQTRLK